MNFGTVQYSVSRRELIIRPLRSLRPLRDTLF